MPIKKESEPIYTHVRDAIMEITGGPDHPAMKPCPVDEPSREVYLENLRKIGEQSREVSELTKKLREEAGE